MVGAVYFRSWREYLWVLVRFHLRLRGSEFYGDGVIRGAAAGRLRRGGGMRTTPPSPSTPSVAAFGLAHQWQKLRSVRRSGWPLHGLLLRGESELPDLDL